MGTNTSGKQQTFSRKPCNNEESPNHRSALTASILALTRSIFSSLLSLG